MSAEIWWFNIFKFQKKSLNDHERNKRGDDTKTSHAQRAHISNTELLIETREKNSNLHKSISCSRRKSQNINAKKSVTNIYISGDQWMQTCLWSVTAYVDGD